MISTRKASIMRSAWNMYLLPFNLMRIKYPKKTFNGNQSVIAYLDKVRGDHVDALCMP